ncbi:MAG: NUDIX domain-containing protein, partial [Lachnospiraceae bacterium]|nr:NUDIX domain-containing protein [Lachnospiraceae bacterium]
MPGINTTLCYIEQNGRYLMLLRNKKAQDLNEGKWIGVGGKFEEGETPEECLLREVKEETGLTLTDYRYRGVITFVSDT